MKGLRVRRSAAAKSDFADVLFWSLQHFGVAAVRRYRALLRQAVFDLAADPMRLGSRAGEGLGPGVRVYHLRHSRRRVVAADRVRSPRHIVVYRIEDAETLVVGRILHDAMDATRHVTPASFR